MHETGHVGPTLTPNKLLTKETRVLENVLNHGRLLLLIMQTISQSHSLKNTLLSLENIDASNFMLALVNRAHAL